MVSFPAHKSVRLITDNAKAKEQYKALGLQPKEFVKPVQENWNWMHG